MPVLVLPRVLDQPQVLGQAPSSSEFLVELLGSVVGPLSGSEWPLLREPA